MALKFTSTQAQNLGRIIHEWRPDWDPQGIMAALSKAALSHRAGPTLTAAQRAAEDTGARTPATILWDKYWTPEPAASHDTGFRRCCECLGKYPVNELSKLPNGLTCPNCMEGTRS